jgi:glutathione S-transferase
MASSAPPDTAAPAQESIIKDSIPKLTLYWLESSRAHRIVWLLEELELPYELLIYSRRPNLFAPKELKEIHPLGKSPVLSVSRPNSSEKPMVIAESGAIVEYLLDHFGSKLVPQRYPDGAEGQPGIETEEWMRYRYYLHYSEGSLMPLLIVALLLLRTSLLESI